MRNERDTAVTKNPTISLSTRKHTLFDADVATINTSQVESFLFNKSLRPNGSPTEKHNQKDVFGESQ